MHMRHLNLREMPVNISATAKRAWTKKKKKNQTVAKISISSSDVANIGNHTLSFKSKQATQVSSGGPR